MYSSFILGASLALDHQAGILVEEQGDIASALTRYVNADRILSVHGDVANSEYSKFLTLKDTRTCQALCVDLVHDLGGLRILNHASPAVYIPIPRDETTNCGFGGDDLRTLFVTASGTLRSLRVRTPGRPACPTLK